MFSIRISPLTPEMLAYAELGAPDRQALISIVDHEWDALERYPARRVLRLCFDDALDASFYQNLITTEQAEAIRDFVLLYKDEIDILIVHCTGGVSRSPAVAAGIVAGLGGDDSCIWNCARYRPNPRVYEWVRAAFEQDDWTKAAR
ncbi:MAG: hypothetical protein LLF75_05620 [Eubacteriales bacterium]|nr:hypothetical protein [Eubacteriales bacterium]